METTQELDFLELTIKRIKSKEIKLFNINQMLHKKYKGILQKYKVEKECNYLASSKLLNFLMLTF